MDIHGGIEANMERLGGDGAQCWADTMDHRFWVLGSGFWVIVGTRMRSFLNLVPGTWDPGPLSFAVYELLKSR